MQSDKELDGLIDRAIASYCDVPPGSGLEQRVLNRIRVAETAPRSFIGARWAVASVLAALILVAIAVRFQRSPTQQIQMDRPPIDRRQIASAGTAMALEQARSAPKLRKSARRRLASVPQPLPKEEQFPAPAPLSSEERLLLAFVKRDPNEAARVFADLERRSGEPLEIEAVEIKPLQADGAH